MKTHSAFKSRKAREKAIASYDNFLTYWPVSYQTRVVATSFGDTHLMISGSPTAKPLILLHGAGINSAMWLSNVKALSEKFQVFAIDLIGEPGKSAETRPSYKSDGYARWLKEVFDALELQEAALCGLSLGGMVAYRFALSYPQSVSSLALLAPPLFKKRKTLAIPAILASFMPTSFFVKRFLNCISTSASAMPEWQINTFAILFKAYRLNLEEIPYVSDHELSQLPAKTIILIGQDDAFYDPVAVVSRISSAASSVRVDIVPGAKHTICSDQAELVNQSLLEFLC